jgi:hypothetical protein
VGVDGEQNGNPAVHEHNDLPHCAIRACEMSSIAKKQNVNGVELLLPGGQDVGGGEEREPLLFIQSVVLFFTSDRENNKGHIISQKISPLFCDASFQPSRVVVGLPTSPDQPCSTCTSRRLRCEVG